VLVDLPGPFAAGRDLAVVPLGDDVLALEHGEVIRDLVAELLILVRVGEEDLDRHDRPSAAEHRQSAPSSRRPAAILLALPGPR
jgi:hypothetical protein